MALEIQLKHGTAASATANNKTLAQGEIGIETDTLKLKIGDGVTAWNSLAYYSTESSESLKIDQTTPQTISNGQPIQDTLTASEIVATSATKKLESLAVETYPSLVELAYVKGVTSAIQTQINALTSTDVSITIAVVDWSGGTTCTKTVTGITTTSDNDLIIPTTTDRDNVASFGVWAKKVITVDGQQDFTADTTPDAAITLIMRIK